MGKKALNRVIAYLSGKRYFHFQYNYNSHPKSESIHLKYAYIGLKCIFTGNSKIVEKTSNL